MLVRYSHAEVVTRLLPLILSLGALALAASALAITLLHRDPRHSTCGYSGQDPSGEADWRCVGNDPPDTRKAPTAAGRVRTDCAPFGRQSGVMVWMCHKPGHG